MREGSPNKFVTTHLLNCSRPAANSLFRHILPITPSRSGFCRQPALSISPNSNEAKILARSQQKILEIYMSAKSQLPGFASCANIANDQSAMSAVCRIGQMSQAAPAITRTPAEVVRLTPVSQAQNGICYAVAGEVAVNSFDLERMVAAVPTKIAAALERKAYYFVPLAVAGRGHAHRRPLRRRAQRQRRLPSQPESGRLAVRVHLDAIDGRQVFRRLRVLYQRRARPGRARRSLAREFSELAWSQVEAGVRGETSLDAWEARKLATANGPDSERYQNEYLEATLLRHDFHLSAVALSRVDYYDLRERDYPLLAPSALAERLRRSSRVISTQHRIRIRHPLQAPRVTP